eukprot:2997065-Prymnesium_polylepis.1
MYLAHVTSPCRGCVIAYGSGAGGLVHGASLAWTCAVAGLESLERENEHKEAGAHADRDGFGCDSHAVALLVVVILVGSWLQHNVHSWSGHER